MSTVSTEDPPETDPGMAIRAIADELQAVDDATLGMPEAVSDRPRRDGALLARRAGFGERELERGVGLRPLRDGGRDEPGRPERRGEGAKQAAQALEVLVGGGADPTPRHEGIVRRGGIR